jgi:formate dehydrogenase subunit gamma
MASLFGGLTVCRVLHPWFGCAFFLLSLAMFFMWLHDMHLVPGERDWLGPKMLQYMRYETDDEEIGKYNGGQKLLFWAVSLGALGLLASGVLMWFPRSFPKPLMELCGSRAPSRSR